MKYLFLFCATPEKLAAWQAPSEDERAQVRVTSQAWMDDHRTHVRSDGGLYQPHTVTSVHRDAASHLLTTDGPFLEGTEVIGGYAVIELDDLDAALRIANTWPDHGTYHDVVEIWPMVME